ncbi:hypothetical protein B0A52_00331 [Exophiala mesophila]|uniref:BTB domain-containing protein n=1 Tax=Exophiala mesophila TaxID=212818 RepID=A0A438NJQ9_EXOME|nr:hypothetical protein B0A52_00331 [Exophiala mesophila]
MGKDESHLLGDKPLDEIEMLDLKGDLILAIGRRHLVVSSKVLTLSCPFFQTMLQSNAFVEGVDQPNANDPPIKEIREDHPDTFSLICRVLHYLPVDPPESIDDYRHLADLCDFYGCAKALSFHVRAWMDQWKLTIRSAPELQTLIWVAFVFGLHNLFPDISFQLALAMAPEEWDDWEVHPMPARLKGTPPTRKVFPKQ